MWITSFAPVTPSRYASRPMPKSVSSHPCRWHAEWSGARSLTRGHAPSPAHREKLSQGSDHSRQEEAMFRHVKELQFNARVSKPDPTFARLLLEQFGGGNGELKAAMQYFVQAFAARQPHPDKYDLLMDTATEEL